MAYFTRVYDYIWKVCASQFCLYRCGVQDMKGATNKGAMVNFRVSYEHSFVLHLYGFRCSAMMRLKAPRYSSFKIKDCITPG